MRFPIIHQFQPLLKYVARIDWAEVTFDVEDVQLKMAIEQADRIVKEANQAREDRDYGTFIARVAEFILFYNSLTKAKTPEGK